MNDLNVVARDEWNKARASVMVKEKELRQASDELSAARRDLPVVEIDKDYMFDSPNGPVSLLDMFEGRAQLIVYSFMFHPDWNEGCPHCSFMVDNFPHLSHLNAANTTVAVISRAPLAKLERFKERMGWSFPWYSSYNTDFNQDFGVTVDDEEQPGLNVFIRNGSTVYHSYSAQEGSGQVLLNTYNFLDLTPLGPQTDGDEDWKRLHDQYESGTPAQSVAD